MADSQVADAIKQWGPVVVSGVVVGLGMLVPKLMDRRKETKEKSGIERLETKMDDYHGEMRRSFEFIQIQLSETDRTATEALHASIGVNGQNGNRGEIKELKERVSDIEKWQENETIRERDRLQRLQDEARLPTSPGITPIPGRMA